MPDRRHWLALFVTIVVIVACLRGLLDSPEDSSPDVGAARTEAEPDGYVREPRAESLAMRAEPSGARDDGSPGPAAAIEVASQGATRESIRGRLEFLDGSPVPLQRIEATLGNAGPDAVPRSATTGLDGSFALDGLPAGLHKLRLDGAASLMPADAVQVAPKDGLVLRVEGFGLLVKTLDASGAIVPGASLQLTGPQRRSSAHSNSQGVAAFTVSQATTGEVEAWKATLRGSLHRLSLPDEAHLIVRELVLLPPTTTGRLDVIVRSRSGSRLNDFSVRLLDSNSNAQVLFLRAKDADSDGTFGNVPVGTFRASLAPAFVGAPELYARNPTRKTVTITEGATATLEFEVELCGRVLLRIERPEATPEQHATLSIRDLDGHTRSLSCRVPGPDDTVEVTSEVPLNATFVVDDHLPDGRYTILGHLPDGTQSDTTILITSGLITQATLRF